MSLMDDFRDAVATINEAFADVQTAVYRKRFLSEDRKGAKQLSAPEPIQALIQPKLKRYYDSGGRLVQQECILTILEPLTVAIDPRDVFIVNGIETPQLVNDGGITDTGTLQNLLNIVTLGKVVG
jgi:hypothetical protein